MRHCNQSSSNANYNDALIKRYQEIHYDYSTEFKNTAVLNIFLENHD